MNLVTTAARAQDAERVQQALNTLRTHVAQQEGGELSPQRASPILAAGAKVAIDGVAPDPQGRGVARARPARC